VPRRSQWHTSAEFSDAVAVLQDTALPRVGLRKLARILGLILIVGGLLLGIWVLAVWQWKDPFTSIYTWWEQRGLVSKYDERVDAFHDAAPAALKGGLTPDAARQLLGREARQYRQASHRGEAIARIQVPRLGLNMIVVNGTDEDSLSRGPGRDLRSFMPGEGELTYIAGHRTTYLAPFADIDSLRKGDPVTLSLPYGVFQYRITGHVIVREDNLSPLESRGYEQLVLQACHPRFFATHRYIAYARPQSVTLPNGHRYRLWDSSPQRAP
jgi:sortase A